MELSPLEHDFLGDLQADDHSLHEVFGFVRLHYPNVEDIEVLRIGREIIASWIGRGWLALAGSGAQWGAAKSIEDLLPIIDRLGTDATRFFVGSPWLTITPQVFQDLRWLPSNKLLEPTR